MISMSDTFFWGRPQLTSCRQGLGVGEGGFSLHDQQVWIKTHDRKGGGGVKNAPKYQDPSSKRTFCLPPWDLRGPWCRPTAAATSSREGCGHCDPQQPSPGKL